MKKSIFLVPALLNNVDMMTKSTGQKQNNYTSNSFIATISRRNFDHSVNSSLQGRAEIHPRRSRVHQHQERSFHKDSYRKRNDNEEPNKQELNRVEKSSERLVRRLIIRNMESVKNIARTNPKLVMKIFEKYLSEVLDCNARILLGKKNLGLINYEDYLMGSSGSAGLNMTYYFNVANPPGFLLYPSLIGGCGHKKKLSITPECGDEQNREDEICNCKQKGASCICQAGIDEPKTAAKHSLSEMIMNGGCACSQPKSIQKNIEQCMGQKDNSRMSTMASSLISGNEIRMRRKCDCSKKNLNQTIDEAKCCSCSKKPKKKRKSRSRSRSKSRSSKSKKHKCDCTEICEPKTPITAEGDHPPKQNTCECLPDLKNESVKIRNPVCVAKPEAKLRCPCPCRELMKMKTVKEGYISADAYGQKEDRRQCVCLTNSQLMKSEGENDQEPPCQSPCGICEEETGNQPHRCNICELVEGLGTGPDDRHSLSTVASSDFERIAGILKDTRNEILNIQNDNNKLLSNIKCFRNSSGIVCQSELVGCPATRGKSKTNTIEIRIKYPTRKTDKNKAKSCATTCTNTKSSEKCCADEANYCEFVKVLQQQISSCCSKPSNSDLSMLLNSFAPRCNQKVDVSGKKSCLSTEKNERKSRSSKSGASEDTKTCTFSQDPTNTNTTGCSLKLDSISCQTSNCETVCKNDEKDVKCIFRRDEPMQCIPNGDDFSCPIRKSSDSLEGWAFEEDNEEIQIGSCSKDSCMRLSDRPSYMTKPKKSQVACDVRNSCVRDKIIEKLFPNKKPPCKIPSKRSIPCEQPMKKKMPSEVEKENGQQTKTLKENKTPTPKDLNKNKAPSKNSINTKNVASKDKPSCSKAYLRPRRDTMKLDKFDQNILAHALDNFLSKGQ